MGRDCPPRWELIHFCRIDESITSRRREAFSRMHAHFDFAATRRGIVLYRTNNNLMPAREENFIYRGLPRVVSLPIVTGEICTTAPQSPIIDIEYDEVRHDILLKWGYRSCFIYMRRARHARLTVASPSPSLLIYVKYGLSSPPAHTCIIWRFRYAMIYVTHRPTA